MNSREYRSILRQVSRNVILKNFPGLRKQKSIIDITVTEIAKNIHARMYGANVDGVDSPIWKDSDNQYSLKTKPNIDASDLLQQEDI